MRKTIPLGYWNSNGIATAIVAVVTECDGALLDWTAYIGGTTKTWKEEDAYKEVAEYGSKLSVDVAIFMADRSGYVELTREAYRP